MRRRGFRRRALSSLALWGLVALFSALALVVGGCATRPPVLGPAATGSWQARMIELTATPFFPQRQYQCGPAALAMILAHSGVAVTPAQLASQVYIPGRQGSLQVEMLAAARRQDRIAYVIDPSLRGIIAQLQRGYPVVVLQNLGSASYPLWHYAVVIGYSLADDRITLRSGTHERLTLPAWLFLKTWKLSGHWGMVALPAGALPALVDRRRYLKSLAAMEGTAHPEVLLAAYQAALREWPGDPTARFGEAYSLQSLGQTAAAEKAYRDLIAGHPRHSLAMNNLATLLAGRGCRKQALATIDRALAITGEAGSLKQSLLDTRQQILADAAVPSRDGCSADPSQG